MGPVWDGSVGDYRLPNQTRWFALNEKPHGELMTDVWMAHVRNLCLALNAWWPAIDDRCSLADAHAIMCEHAELLVLYSERFSISKYFRNIVPERSHQIIMSRGLQIFMSSEMLSDICLTKIKPITSYLDLKSFGDAMHVQSRRCVETLLFTI